MLKRQNLQVGHRSETYAGDWKGPKTGEEKAQGTMGINKGAIVVWEHYTWGKKSHTVQRWTV